MNKAKIFKKLKAKLLLLEPIIEDIRNINLDPEDEETWDADYYSELESNCQQALGLLSNMVVKDKYNEFGDPVISEPGIVTLMEEYNSEEDEEE